MGTGDHNRPMPDQDKRRDEHAHAATLPLQERRRCSRLETTTCMPDRGAFSATRKPCGRAGRGFLRDAAASAVASRRPIRRQFNGFRDTVEQNAVQRSAWTWSSSQQPEPLTPTPVAGIFTHTSEHATGRQRSQASPGAHSRLLTPLATANLAHTNERADGPFPPRRLAGARTKLRKPTDTRHRRCASIGGPTKPAPCWAVKTLLRVRVQSSPQPPQAASNWTRRHAPAAGPLDAERRSCARISSTLGDQRPRRRS
ncbi:hypothetical protein ACCO45_009526 [Purpureocillium lilacinum]|uniref:Uncharacterized protein n=1 Tax=Purpureocillium lilacinum TaxID=33203 RepID=A0ACC4DK25_PURLI